MNAQLLQGECVRLEALTSAHDIEMMKNWTRPSALWRMLDVTPARAPKTAGHAGVHFMIFPLYGGRPIGHTGLFGINWAAGEAWLSIGLGDRKHWGTGYGTDALRAILRYAFADLSLSRVLLGVFDYDARAILSYEQVGFVIEGRMLQEAGRNSQSRAGVFMGLRRDAWEATHNVPCGMPVS